MSDWLASLRTTNGMRLPFRLVSSRTRCARYKPDTAVDGTAHEADTDQLPQSMSPVGAVSFLGRRAGTAGASPTGPCSRRPCGRHCPGSTRPAGCRCDTPSPECLILKDSVCPAFTLIDVAKPWSVESPAPLTCQSLAGSPVCWFSQAIGLIVGPQDEPAAAAGGLSVQLQRWLARPRAPPPQALRSGVLKQAHQ